MVLQSAYCFSDATSTTVEISKETLGSILLQIETELYNSEIYRRAMAGLQTMLGESIETAHIMVKAVGREAIRLAFQQVAKQYKVVPVISPQSSPQKEEQLPSASTATEEAIAPDTAEVLSPEDVTLESNQDAVEVDAQQAPIDFDNLDDLLKPFGLTSALPSFTKIPKKANKEELAEAILQLRAERLCQIGQEIMQARQLRLLSREQLHRQTLVPIYHIEALETGRIDKLPEDVYVRSFIRLLANAVGLNGVTMAGSLPETDAIKSVVPSWYRSSSSPSLGLSLTPVHLYVGYAALVAGAVGGLTWMSQQSTSGISVQPNTHFSSQTPDAHKAERTEAAIPGVKATKRGITIGADMAPPEQSF